MHIIYAGIAGTPRPRPGSLRGLAARGLSGAAPVTSYPAASPLTADPLARLRVDHDRFAFVDRHGQKIRDNENAEDPR